MSIEGSNFNLTPTQISALAKQSGGQIVQEGKGIKCQLTMADGTVQSIKLGELDTKQPLTNDQKSAILLVLKNLAQEYQADSQLAMKNADTRISTILKHPEQAKVVNETFSRVLQNYLSLKGGVDDATKFARETAIRTLSANSHAPVTLARPQSRQVAAAPPQSQTAGVKPQTPQVAAAPLQPQASVAQSRQPEKGSHVTQQTKQEMTNLKASFVASNADGIFSTLMNINKNIGKYSNEDKEYIKKSIENMREAFNKKGVQLGPTQQDVYNKLHNALSQPTATRSQPSPASVKTPSQQPVATPQVANSVVRTQVQSRQAASQAGSVGNKVQVKRTQEQIIGNFHQNVQKLSSTPLNLPLDFAERQEIIRSVITDLKELAQMKSNLNGKQLEDYNATMEILNLNYAMDQMEKLLTPQEMKQIGSALNIK